MEGSSRYHERQKFLDHFIINPLVVSLLRMTSSYTSHVSKSRVPSSRIYCDAFIHHLRDPLLLNFEKSHVFAASYIGTSKFSH